MTDFIVDFRRPERRKIDPSRIEFCSGIRVDVLDKEAFTLAIARPDRDERWGWYSSRRDGVLIALAGRIALDENDWKRGLEFPGVGGIACKTLYGRFSCSSYDLI